MPAFAVFGLSLVPGHALADHDGVSVDPDSPAGVEYAIPIETAREQGSAGTENTPRPGGDGAGMLDRGAAPLFGSGIAPPESGGPGSDVRPGNRGGSGSEDAEGDASRGGSAGDADRDDRDGAGSGASGQRNERGGSASPSPSSEARVNTGSPLSNPWVIGVAAIVLLLGALAGLVGRKHRRAST